MFMIAGNCWSYRFNFQEMTTSELQIDELTIRYRFLLVAEILLLSESVSLTSEKFYSPERSKTECAYLRHTGGGRVRNRNHP
jgi:hypothetical protein